MTAGIGIAALPLADSPLGRTIATPPRTSGTTRARSTSSSTRSASARSGRRPTRRSSSTSGTRSRATGAARVAALAVERPDATVTDLAWAVVEEMSIRGAPLLEPVFEAPAGGRAGSRSRPTRCCSGRRPRWSTRPSSSLARAEHHREVAGHDRSGSERSRRRRSAASASTSRSASPSPQAIAAAEAIERGLRRRDAEGLPATHGAGGHADDGPRRGLAARGRRPRRARDRPGRTAVERCCRVQAGLRRVPDARVPGAAAGRGDPPPLPLVGADRRRRRSSRFRPPGSAGSMPRTWRSGRGSTTRCRPRSSSQLRRLHEFVEGVRAGRARHRRVRRLRRNRSDAARVHRLVPGTARARDGRAHSRTQTPSMTSPAGAAGALHRRAGSTAAEGWDLVVTPESAGWDHTGLRVATLAPGEHRSFATERDEAIVLPLAGSLAVTCDEETVELAGRRGRVRRPDRLRVPAARHHDDARKPHRRQGRRDDRSGRPSPAVPARPGSRRARRAPWSRAVLAGRAQLRVAGRIRGRPADRGRGRHAGRQLVLVPAPQAR